MHDDRTPRGWPLPHADNYLEDDVARLREALSSADSELTDAIRALQETKDAVQAVEATFDQKLLELKGTVHDDVMQKLAQKAALVNGIEFQDFGLDTALGSRRMAATQHGFVLVRGVGLFFLDPSADDPADGETCILPAEGVSGRWMLLVPDADWLFALSKKESDELSRRLEQSNNNLLRLLAETQLRIEALEARKLLKLLESTAELTWTAIAQAGGTQEQTISLPGAAIGDCVLVVPPQGLVSGIVFSGSVKNANAVAVRCVNVTGAAITPVKANWTVKIVKEAQA